MVTENQINPENWVNNYGNYLLNYAMSRVNDLELANDLIQDTFMSALTAARDFKGQSSEKTWLVAILKHKIIDHYRKKGRSKIIGSIDETYDEGRMNKLFISEGRKTGHWKEESMPQRWHSNTEDQMESEEFRRILQKCLENLPDKLSSVFTLRVIEEIPTEEVCKELNITTSNLWVILHRSRLQLHECIEIFWK